MSSNVGSMKDEIARCLEATDHAVDVIREGEFMRRQIALELRDLQLTMNEDFQMMKKSLADFDNNIHEERKNSGKWMNSILHQAKLETDKAIKSRVLLRDIQLLEKKVDILQDSVVNVNHAYAQYEDQVDIGELKQQIVEMAYRTEKKEKELIDKFKGNNAEEKIENLLRGAIESLLGLQLSNPKILEEAKDLAIELRTFRDAAANKNLFNLIMDAKQKANPISTTTSESSEHTLSEPCFSALEMEEAKRNGNFSKKQEAKSSILNSTSKSSASPYIDFNLSSTSTISSTSSSTASSKNSGSTASGEFKSAPSSSGQSSSSSQMTI